MKVLFLAPASSVHTQRWVNALAERGIDVYLVSIKGHEAAAVTLHEKVRVKTLKHGGTMGYYLNRNELRNYYREVQPDVVNAHYASGYGTLARVSTVRPSLLSFWGSDIYEFPYQNGLNRRIITMNIKAADRLTATSHCMAWEVRKVMNNDSLDIDITPFGVDLTEFDPARFRDARGKSDGKYIIGTVKSLEKIYNIDKLIEGFHQLLEMCAPEVRDKLQLHIYGEGSMRGVLEEYIKANGLEDKVFLKGFIDHSKVAEAISSFDLFCAFSQKESFGVSIVEAMAMGKPVVVSKCEGFTEVVDNGETGIVVEDLSRKSIAAAMKYIMDNPSVAGELGTKARASAAARYNWNHNVDNMIKVYEELCGTV